MVGDVVGHLDHPDADVGEDSRHLRVIAQHGAVLEAENHAEHVVGRRGVDLVDGPDDPDHVRVVPAEVPEGADPGHGPGQVLPHADRGVHHVDPAGPHLSDHLAGPVVDLQSVDDHGHSSREASREASRHAGRAGRTQSSVVWGPSSASRGAP